MNPPPQKSVENSSFVGTLGSMKIGLFVFLLAFYVLAFSTPVDASVINQGYAAEQNFPPGSLVSISRDNPDVLELTNTNNEEYVAGVVSSEEDGLLVLSDSDSELYVAQSGDSSILVSNINGDIKRGDLLSPSPISGVAQRTTNEANAKVIGVALSDFNLTGGELTTVGDQEVFIGQIGMQVVDSDAAPSEEASNNSSFLARIGLAIAGSEVSVIRVLISGLIFMAGAFIAGMMLFSSVKGSMTSLGRNPLASESIYSGMFHVTLVAVSVMVVGVIMAYLVLAL